MAQIPVIPEKITVHLGPPGSNAENVTVTFPAYIKNVASNELYPTWPESAVLANIYAIISFALNRVLTGYYRKQGYDYDITNSLTDDLLYTYDRTFYRNVSEIVDGIFNDYVVKGISNEPYLTEFCPGRNGSCPAGVLSQWGSVDLADTGYKPFQILQYYYGNDIGIIRNAPVENLKLYEGPPMRLGSADENVRLMQRMLNKIAGNYPAIPKIPEINGIYNEATKAAVLKFQEIFSMTPNGVIGKAEWYRIQIIYNLVKMVGDLYSIGATLYGVEKLYKKNHALGDTDLLVTFIQFYLNRISEFYEKIPPVDMNGIFDKKTRGAVMAFQQAYGLKPDGVVGPSTWSRLLEVYGDILAVIPEELKYIPPLRYPGNVITTGSPPQDVRQVQTFLRLIAQNDENIPLVEVDGVFGPKTKEAVVAFQKEEGFPHPGYVAPLTWSALVRRYDEYHE